MIRQITVIFAALMLSGAMLSGCSTIMSGATEDIRINTAGANEALCDVTQGGRRYRVYAPSTFRAMRSPDDMRIHCRAPGNRDQIVLVKSEISDNAAYNVSNLGLGVGWDAMSGALYNYPDVILMDFRGVAPSSYPQPDYQDVFDRNPELMQMEQFRPGNPALGSDMGTPTPTLQPRSGDEDNSMGIMMPSASSSVPGTSSSSSSTATKAPLPPIVAPVAPVAATTTTTTTNVTPGTNTNTTGTTTTTTGSNTPGVSSSTTTTGSSVSSRIFTGKIGQVPAISK